MEIDRRSFLRAASLLAVAASGETAQSPAPSPRVATACRRCACSSLSSSAPSPSFRSRRPTAVVFALLTRLLGARHAERLAVRGLLLDPQEACRIGLVDELAPVERVVERALDWCRSLLELPAEAMRRTRHQARRDLVELFRATGGEMEEVVERWLSAETQAGLADLARRLTARRSALGAREAG